MGEDVGDKGDVGLDAPDVLLADGPHRLVAGAHKGVVPGGDLDQQGVVVGGDDRAGVGVAAVQPDAEAAAGAVGGDFARVGGEVVGRVLSGDTALDGVAVDVHVLLARQADAGVGQGAALGDEDLCPHQVHAGDHLGDRVLHLNPGVHLNEVVVAVPVHQELHRARVDIAHVAGHLHRVGVEPVPDLLGHAPGGGVLHHLLVPPLEGAVPLPQVHHVAVLVAQNLHFDVLGLHQILLNKDVLAAKGLFGLAAHQLKGGGHLLRGVAPAHAPAAAAGGGLEDDGEAVGDGLLQSLLRVPQGAVGAGDGGHAAGNGRGLGGQLVAHAGEYLRGRADELDALRLTGPGKVRVLGQKAVARVDGLHLPPLGQVDDGGNVQIGPQGGLVLADEVGLVGAGAEQAVDVLMGVHGHGVEPQVVAGAEHPDGDLAPVGHQYLVEYTLCHLPHPFFPLRRTRSGGGRGPPLLRSN